MTIRLLFAGTTALIGASALALSAASATTQEAGQTYSGDRLSVDNFIGRIEIREGSGDTISVSIQRGEDDIEMPDISQRGATVAIDGGQRVRNLNCQSRRGSISIGQRWRSRRPIEDYPLLVITAPASVHFELEDSAFVGEAGDLGSLDLAMNSCGRFEAGNIVGEVNLRINGSGDIVTGTVGGAAQIDVNGSGDVRLGAVNGDVDIGISGSGDVVTGDVAGDASVEIRGSGDVRFGSVRGLDVGVFGSGDVNAAAMDGAFNGDISGSGDIAIAGGHAQPFEASIRGSGDIALRGTATDVTIREYGSGDVRIDTMGGSVDWRRNGRAVRVSTGD